MRFEIAPEALTRRQRNLVIVVSIVVALTRMVSLSRSMWEWDEALFASGVREFDVTQHNPHPPGYPLYIAAAKAVRLVVHSDFRALQAVTLLGAMALFPLVFLLARELRFSFATSLGGALIFVFAPNVWYFGGTAFSDVPGVALILAACVLLLRGCRDGRSYLLGALVLGLAVGLRPQGILAGAAPALLATGFQLRVSWRRVLAAIAIGAAVVAICYVGAAYASASPSAYLDILKAQQKYVHDVDSYHNIHRAPLVPTLLRPFFYETMHAGRDAARIVAVFAAIALLASVLRPHPGVGLLILIFAPLNFFSWLMLDMQASSRYAVSYLPMYALLAAFGMEAICRWPFAVGRGSTTANGQRPTANEDRPTANAIHAALTIALAAHLAYRAYPAIRDAGRSSAPNAAAMEWIARNLDPRKTRIYVVEGLGPFASYSLEPKYQVVYVASGDDVPQSPSDREEWFVTDAITSEANAYNFVRPRKALWKVARRRYFEASVSRVSGKAHFDDGWYDLESDGTRLWRWMSSRGTITFPPMRGNARLKLDFFVPIDSLPAPPTIEIALNGNPLARILCTKAEYSLTWIVPSRTDAPNVLTLATTATANPKKLGTADDTRDLGLLLNSYSWSPAGSAAR